MRVLRLVAALLGLGGPSGGCLPARAFQELFP